MTKLGKQMKRRLRKLLFGSQATNPQTLVQQPTLIEKIARFVACEMIEGDYLEFGVYQGHSFCKAYHALQDAFESRISDAGGDNATEHQSALRRRIWEEMRFFAFDSFQGLPELEGIDRDTKDFQAGQYAFAENSFRERVQGNGVPKQRFQTVAGWFDQTCTEQKRDELQVTKAAVVWIDGDLYESAKPPLRWITPLLQDGTVIVFDDWFAFRGSPFRGEQRAFGEWLETLEGYVATPFHSEGVWRTSFIMNEIPSD